MIAIQSIEDMSRLRESVALECKLAAGHDGKGALPEDFWPTYSAFTNTNGGVVLLGVREKKEPAGFVFRNPGALRVPAELALQGGVSDCRNRTLQQMFLMIGLGERAGSGMLRIIHGWQDTGHSLRLYDTYEPNEHSLLEMRWMTLPARPDSPKSSVKSSVKSSEQILAHIASNPYIAIPEMAALLGISTRAVEKQLARLQEQGRLRRVGPAKSGHWEILK